MCWTTYLDAPHLPSHDQFKCRVLVIIRGHGVHDPLSFACRKESSDDIINNVTEKVYFPTKCPSHILFFRCASGAVGED